MRFKNYLKEEVSDSELKTFENKWLSNLKSMGLTNFEFNKHMNGSGDGRVNDKRNSPPITIKELDFVMDSFVKKMGGQLRKDISDVSKHIAKKRGKNKQEIPDNCIEYTIKSVSTKINLVLALRQDRKQSGKRVMNLKGSELKGTAVIIPITIQRKKNWITKKGVEIVVERTELDGIKKEVMVE